MPDPETVSAPIWFVDSEGVYLCPACAADDFEVRRTWLQVPPPGGSACEVCGVRPETVSAEERLEEARKAMLTRMMDALEGRGSKYEYGQVITELEAAAIAPAEAERARLRTALWGLVGCIDWMPSSGFASFVVMDPERLRVARDLLAPLNAEGEAGP